MTKILVLISAVIYFTACTVKTTEKLTDVRHPYGVFIGAEKEKLLSLNNYDVLVIDAELLTAENIDVIHQNGNNEIYSYLNIGSVEDFRSYYEEFLPFTIGEYEDWDNEKWIDVSSENGRLTSLKQRMNWWIREFQDYLWIIPMFTMYFTSRKYTMRY